MKNTGIILLGVAAGLVTAVIAYAILSNAQNSEPLSDEEFIEQARSSAAESTTTEVATAPVGSAVADATTQPSIELETNHYEMGTISNEEPTKGQVMVYNRGKSPLQISRVTTQCGCTQGAMAKGQETIPAGGQAPLEVTVDPFRIPGFSSTKTLTLFTNDPKNPSIQVKVSADVDPSVLFEVKGPEEHTSCMPVVKTEVKVKGDLTDEQLKTIERLVHHSPVHGLVANANKMETEIKRG